jgi:hypothetical protein
MIVSPPLCRPVCLSAHGFIRAAILLSIVSLAACEGDGVPKREAGAPGERRVATARWDTLWSVGGSLQDSILLQPSRLAASGDRVYVFDGAAARLLAFSASEGSLAWMAGRKGSGPGEFKMVRDLEIGSGGRPMLLDVGNGRITTVERSGAVHHQTRLVNVGYVDQFAPLSDGRAVLLTEDPDSALAIADTSGGIVRRLGLPWKEFADLHPLVRQGNLASGANGRWAFGFGLGDGWFGFSGTQPEGGRRPYIERTEFPQMVQKREGGSLTTQLASYTPCSACGMTIDGTDFYVLFGGRTDNRHAVLDRYDLRTGRYRESLVLPAKATEAAVADGTYFLLVEEPAPMLLALRPIPSPAR